MDFPRDFTHSTRSAQAHHAKMVHKFHKIMLSQAIIVAVRFKICSKIIQNFSPGETTVHRKRRGLKVSVLNFRIECSGLSTGGGHCLLFWVGGGGRHLTIKVPLSMQLYKKVLGNLMFGGTCYGLASHAEGTRITLSRLILRKPG